MSIDHSYTHDTAPQTMFALKCDSQNPLQIINNYVGNQKNKQTNNSFISLLKKVVTCKSFLLVVKIYFSPSKLLKLSQNLSQTYF